MTARELIDHLSGTLLCDERILSASERELLANLLQRTRSQASAPANAAAEAITRSVGEIIAERALGVLGESITQQLFQQLPGSSSFPTRGLPVIHAGSPAVPPPSPAPPPDRPPSTSPPSNIRAGSPAVPPPGPVPSPGRPPSTSPPSHTHAGTLSQRSAGGVAVLDAADSSQVVVLDEFLTPAEVNALTQYVLAQEAQFQISEVLSPGVSGGAIDYEQRRSRVLMDLGGHEKVITDRLLTCLPRILQKWGRDPFHISHVESQTTASNHGDFFRCHSDNAAPEVASREVTFVYFFHREPKEFSGGELRIYDSTPAIDGYPETQNYRSIVPEQNQLVLFASGLSHEITPVRCPSGKFADSRFTVNGWLHK